MDMKTMSLRVALTPPPGNSVPEQCQAGVVLQKVVPECAISILHVDRARRSGRPSARGGRSKVEPG